MAHNFSWQQTMLRVKDPVKSVRFYEEQLGMTLIDRMHFEDFSLYFLATLPHGSTCPEPGTLEAHKFLWTMRGTCLELTHNHGTENQPEFKYNNGNEEPHRGFGHIAFMTPDVYAATEELSNNGVAFRKRPDEGRMKGLAFALDPDGYWIEIIRRAPDAPFSNKYNLAQTMIRVKDPEASLRFYRDLLGMSLVAAKHMSDFSLYFLAHLRDGETAPADPFSEEAYEAMKRMFHPVIELTHNHGTENDPDFSYHNGNTEPRGFGHTGFLVDDLQAACNYLEENGVTFQKRPEEGKMRELAFVKDPDGYWVEIIQRGFGL